MTLLELLEASPHPWKSNPLNIWEVLLVLYVNVFFWKAVLVFWEDLHDKSEMVFGGQCIPPENVPRRIQDGVALPFGAMGGVLVHEQWQAVNHLSFGKKAWTVYPICSLP